MNGEVNGPEGKEETGVAENGNQAEDAGQ